VASTEAPKQLNIGFLEHKDDFVMTFSMPMNNLVIDHEMARSSLCIALASFIQKANDIATAGKVTKQ
jgi:hypothetical protein